MEFERTVISRTGYLRIASAMKKGVNGEVDAELPGAGPLVCSAMGDLVGAVVVRCFLAVIDLPVELAR